MSLRIWLPLNGDLHNQGISNAIFSKTTNVWGTGKIGEQSLLTSTGTGNVMVNELKDKKEFSIAYWIKVDSSLTFSNWQDIWAVDYTNATGTYPIRDEHTNTAGNHQLLMAKETNVGSNTNGYISMTIANAPDTWQHIVLVKGLIQTKSYVNGKLKLTRNNTDFETSSGKLTGNVRIGASTCGAYLNDFRIYDHCLSTAEIKEISEGLVLHYKLNGPMGGNNSNLLLTKDSTYISNTKSFELQGWVMNLFTKTWMNENLVVGQKYTLSYKVTCISRPNGTWARTETRIMPILVHQGGGMNQSTFCTSTKTTDMQVGESKEFITTFTFATITESQEYYGLCMYTMLFNDGSSNQYAKFRIENLKLEEGDKVTSWCPNITELGINTTIIEDSSGYNHNGEILNGPLSFIKDTSRYDICTHFSATNQKIKLSNFSTSGFGNSYTFAWWAKISSVSPMHWGFANGIRLNGLYTGRLWNTGDSSNNPLYNPGTTTQVTAPSINEWHHWVMTGDGSKCLVYQDGELWAEAKTYKAISGTEIYINGWNANTDYSSNNYSVSDFRIYCTALSADDIKELYQTSASIDKNGDVFTYELSEQNGNYLTFNQLAFQSSSGTYDKETNTWDITTQLIDDNWGHGLILQSNIVANRLYIPWGKSYRLTMEVWTPTTREFKIDYNNWAEDMTDMSGNDNDNVSGRLPSITVPANQWTRITYGSSNTNLTKNPHQQTLYDGSYFGFNTKSGALTYKIRNVQWYLVSEDNSITKNGQIISNYFNETNLQQQASIRKKEKSFETNQFIEK